MLLRMVRLVDRIDRDTMRELLATDGNTPAVLTYLSDTMLRA